MNKATLVGLVMMSLGSGCARNAVVAAPAAPAKVAVSPYAHLESVGLWRDCDGHCGGPEACLDAADSAYYASGGQDAAYEDAYAACTAGAR